MSDVAISDSIGRFLRASVLATLDLLHLRMRLAAQRQVQVSKSSVIGLMPPRNDRM